MPPEDVVLGDLVNRHLGLYEVLLHGAPVLSDSDVGDVDQPADVFLGTLGEQGR